MYLFEYLEYLEYSVLKIVTIVWKIWHGSTVSFMYSREMWLLRTQEKLEMSPNKWGFLYRC